MKLVVFLFLVSSSGWACSFDTDCAYGSTCVKNIGSLYGVCDGGTRPGNDNDYEPVRGTFNEKTGSTCQSTMDCDIGVQCHKDWGRAFGVCY